MGSYATSAAARAPISENNDLNKAIYQHVITPASPLTLTNNGTILAIDLSAHALKTDVPGLQASLTATLPLSITSNTISINLSSYTTASSVISAIATSNTLNNGLYQPKLTAISSPLSLTNNGTTLSIDLSMYQAALVTGVYGTPNN